MVTHKDRDWGRWSTAELRSRRAGLLAGLPSAEKLLAGALVEQHRTCGRQGCRCSRGQPHGPYVYLQVAGRLMYVPAGLAELVRSYVELSDRLRESLEEISGINLELLSRRELD
ncbi:MAG: hypothetical protein JO100_05570 [Pseudonocardia sp.]|nr:hypothetical protein [Pseudonocardia sp.]